VGLTASQLASRFNVWFSVGYGIAVSFSFMVLIISIAILEALTMGHVEMLGELERVVVAAIYYKTEDKIGEEKNFLVADAGADDVYLSNVERVDKIVDKHSELMKNSNASTSMHAIIGCLIAMSLVLGKFTIATMASLLLFSINGGLLL